MIKALIFDFDGLILDTETADYNSWQEVFVSFGTTLPLPVWEDCIGRENGVFDPLVYLESKLGRSVNRAEVHAARRQRYHELVEGQPLRPGIESYVENAKQLGLKLGVASSAPRHWVTGHLTRRGLLSSFDCIKSADDVPRAKPEPDLYLAVLEALALASVEALALEDAPHGIRAAKRAGLFCVAVPNTITKQLVLNGADLRLDSLADLPLSELLEIAKRYNANRAANVRADL